MKGGARYDEQRSTTSSRRGRPSLFDESLSATKTEEDRSSDSKASSRRHRTRSQAEDRWAAEGERGPEPEPLVRNEAIRQTRLAKLQQATADDSEPFNPKVEDEEVNTLGKGVEDFVALLAAELSSEEEESSYYTTEMHSVSSTTTTTVEKPFPKRKLLDLPTLPDMSTVETARQRAPPPPPPPPPAMVQVNVVEATGLDGGVPTGVSVALRSRPRDVRRTVRRQSPWAQQFTLYSRDVARDAVVITVDGYGVMNIEVGGLQMGRTLDKWFPAGQRVRLHLALRALKWDGHSRVKDPVPRAPVEVTAAESTLGPDPTSTTLRESDSEC